MNSNLAARKQQKQEFLKEKNLTKIRLENNTRKKSQEIFRAQN